MSKYCEHLDCLSNLASCERCDDRNCCDDDTCVYVNTLNKAILKAKAFDVIKEKLYIKDTGYEFNDIFGRNLHSIELYSDDTDTALHIYCDDENFNIIKQALEVDE